MKSLYIVRHAKSSWDNPNLSDFDRPLNDRGEKDAPRMGKRLKERRVTPDAIYSSPAVRALTTAKIIAGILGFDPGKITALKELYHAEEDAWLEILRKVNPHFDCVMMFGHNPGLTEFANELLDETIDNVPTTGIVAARLNIKDWKDASWGCGKLDFLDFPKKKS